MARSTKAVVFSVMGELVPGASALESIIDAYQERQLEAAKAILLEELASGQKSLADVAEIDEAAGAVFRYSRAALEGAARTNLRLLAKIIAGHQIGQRPLYASDFQRYADLLAPLSREELLLLASFHRHRLAAEASGQYAGPNLVNQAASRSAIEELVPAVFRDADEVAAIANALMRTGLILPQMALQMGVWGTTFLMNRLAELADIEATLAAEPPRT